MLLAFFINDDAMTGYGTPFEIYHSKMLGLDSSYWVRSKTGEVPGFSASVVTIPEIKMSIIVMMNNADAFGRALDILPVMLPAFEQTLQELALPPPTPFNLTAFAGTYIASTLLGFVSANITIKSNEEVNMLALYLDLKSPFGDMSAGSVGYMVNATWETGNTFRLHPKDPEPCMYREGGFTDVFVFFHTNGKGKVISATLPSMDPFYGWTFTKQS